MQPRVCAATQKPLHAIELLRSKSIGLLSLRQLCTICGRELCSQPQVGLSLTCSLGPTSTSKNVKTTVRDAAAKDSMPLQEGWRGLP